MRYLFIVLALLALGYVIALNWAVPGYESQSQPTSLSYSGYYSGCTDEDLQEITESIEEAWEADPDWDGNVMHGQITCVDESVEVSREILDLSDWHPIPQLQRRPLQ